VTVDLMARLLPPEVVTRETTEDLPVTVRYAAEEAAVDRAVETRRREFFTVRACARQALAELGVPELPIPHGPAGSPRWPAGIAGSLTHCDGYRAAAVVRRLHYGSVGIDAEPCAGLPAGVLDLVASPGERAHLARLAGDDPSVPWDRVQFSAKESVYKAWYPLTAQWLDFAQVVVALRPGGTFVARVCATAPTVTDAAGRVLYRGRWGMQHDIVATAVAVGRKHR
jgi:4'-phosphopantetheinyl transferase EntD